MVAFLAEFVVLEAWSTREIVGDVLVEREDSDRVRLQLEAMILRAMRPAVCLDPSTDVAITANRRLFERKALGSIAVTGHGPPFRGPNRRAPSRRTENNDAVPYTARAAMQFVRMHKAGARGSGGGPKLPEDPALDSALLQKINLSRNDQHVVGLEEGEARREEDTVMTTMMMSNNNNNNASVDSETLPDSPFGVAVV